MGNAVVDGTAMTAVSERQTLLLLSDVTPLSITDVRSGYTRCTFPRPTSSRRHGTFWDKVDASSDGCWPWIGARLDTGYGAVSREGKVHKAHRLAYAAAHGDPGDCVLHSCDNPPCCNPAHLFAGSMADNTADMVGKGRHNRHGRRVLTEEAVRAIRHAYASGQATQRVLAERYGVSSVAICLVVNRRTWRHVDAPAEGSVA